MDHKSRLRAALYTQIANSQPCASMLEKNGEIMTNDMNVYLLIYMYVI